MPDTSIIIEKDIRRIAREESEKVFAKATKRMCQDIEVVRAGMEQNKEILSRLERLLLGEIGIDEGDTLKARATFAYNYAKRNTDLRIIERAEPALDWFEDMNTLEAGHKETKLESLGKLIEFYMNVRWLLALIGFTTILNALPYIVSIIEWFQSLGY